MPKDALANYPHHNSAPASRLAPSSDRARHARRRSPNLAASARRRPPELAAPPFVPSARGRSPDLAAPPPRARRRSPDLALPSSEAPDKPRWDRTSRKLWFGCCLVKEFPRPSVCQILILEAFEEQGWPDSIDDPLPVSHDIDPKRRLHDAIKRLNRNQRCPILSFHGNGNGEGIVCRVRASMKNGND